MMLLERLRTATATSHRQLDEMLVPAIQHLQTIEEYADLLILFYAFFKPMYLAIDKYLDISLLPDYNTRRKPDLLLEDLKSLHTDKPIQVCSSYPVITNNASAFGALYVLEGSTLGGLIIKKMIAEKLGISSGLSFFSGYDKQTKERWNIFIKALQNLAGSDKNNIMVTQAASATFDCFKNWLRLQLANEYI